MKFNELKTKSKTSRRRVGRGISAGQGKTAGRGTKGQHSRAGFSRRASFEGGQTPLAQRIPKAKGFKSLRIPAQVVYTDVLNAFKGKIVNNQTLREAGFIADPFHSVKIITRGQLSKALDVKLDRASRSAVKMIEAAGGSFTATPTPRKENKDHKIEPKQSSEKA